MKTITLINQSIIAQSFRFVCFVGCFFSLLVLGSCGASQVPVKLGYINTEGVEIRAEDGSFSLQSGDSWAPPFRSNDAISFVAGILKMNYWKFISATILGIAPLTFLIAITGEDIDSLKIGLLWGSIVSLLIFGIYIWWDKKRKTTN